MYCATVFWRHLMYYYIVKNPTSYLAVDAEVYFHFPSGILCGSRPVRFIATWV